MTRPLALFSAAFLWTFCLLMLAVQSSRILEIPEYKEPVQSWCNAAEVRKLTWNPPQIKRKPVDVPRTINSTPFLTVGDEDAHRNH